MKISRNRPTVSGGFATNGQSRVFTIQWPSNDNGTYRDQAMEDVGMDPGMSCNERSLHAVQQAIDLTPIGCECGSAGNSADQRTR